MSKDLEVVVLLGWARILWSHNLLDQDLHSGLGLELLGVDGLSLLLGTDSRSQVSFSEVVLKADWLWALLDLFLALDVGISDVFGIVVTSSRTGSGLVVLSVLAASLSGVAECLSLAGVGVSVGPWGTSISVWSAVGFLATVSAVSLSQNYGKTKTVLFS